MGVYAGGFFYELCGLLHKGSTKLCEYINQVILRKILLLVWVKLKSSASPGISAHHNHQTTITCTKIGFFLSQLVAAGSSHHQEAVFQTHCYKNLHLCLQF